MASKKKNAKKATPKTEIPQSVLDELAAQIPAAKEQYTKPHVPDFDELEGVSIVSTGTKTQQVVEEYESVLNNTQQQDVVPDTTAGTSLEDIFDRFSKLVYVIDASGSMGEGMKDEDQLGMYIWPPEKLEALRGHLAKLEAAAAKENEEFDDIEFEEEETVKLSEASDDELKRHIIRNAKSAGRWGGGDANFEGFVFPMNSKFNARKNQSKMQILKGAAKQFVSKRFAKFADAKVAVMQFEDSPSLLCASGASEREVLAAIEMLPDHGGGGTNIYRAVTAGISDCKRRPSEVGAHHIVLVSDGCDRGALQIKDLVPKMKETGIVFDFIFVQGLAGDAEGADVARVLKSVCEATGGEYTEVRTAQDFETKFLAVSNRPMLPPARS